MAYGSDKAATKLKRWKQIHEQSTKLLYSDKVVTKRIYTFFSLTLKKHEKSDDWWASSRHFEWKEAYTIFVSDDFFFFVISVCESGCRLTCIHEKETSINIDTERLYANQIKSPSIIKCMKGHSHRTAFEQEKLYICGSLFMVFSSQTYISTTANTTWSKM